MLITARAAVLTTVLATPLAALGTWQAVTAMMPDAAAPAEIASDATTGARSIVDSRTYLASFIAADDVARTERTTTWGEFAPSRDQAGGVVGTTGDTVLTRIYRDGEVIGWVETDRNVAEKAALEFLAMRSDDARRAEAANQVAQRRFAEAAQAAAAPAPQGRSNDRGLGSDLVRAARRASSLRNGASGVGQFRQPDFLRQFSSQRSELRQARRQSDRSRGRSGTRTGRGF